MVTTTLSGIKSPSLSTTLNNVVVKQFKRTFSNDVSLNFSNYLANTIDHKPKNYTNFYLVSNIGADNLFSYESNTFQSSNIKTSFKWGNVFLQFSEADKEPYKLADRYKERSNYGKPTFSNTENDYTLFNLEIRDNNTCRIYYFLDFKKYYLCLDVNDKLSFVLERLIPTSGTINPHDFSFLWSESSNSLLLFKKTATSDYIVTKIGSELKVINNIVNAVTTPFVLSRSIYENVDASFNTKVIQYTNDNQIGNSFQVKNNILIHRPINQFIISPIVLKNQLDTNDNFSYSNSLLSGGVLLEYCDEIREYTNIFQDIKEEETDELELNYVIFNKNYRIKPGKTTFVTPSSMYPFVKLNINDTTFKYSGAFSYLTPEYSDKIYRPYFDTNLQGQHLLCTWLSGHPTGTEKVWVDRYYYPDVISKENAISYYAPANATYINNMEQLLLNDSELKSDVEIEKVFDKLSDMTFEPNTSYIYERISTSNLPSLTGFAKYCTNNTNYFEQINETQQFAVGFYFSGNNDDWTVVSSSNDENSLLKFEKTANILSLTFKLFDSSTNTIKSWSVSVPIKQYKENFVLASVNGLTGRGYFFLNNETILNFNIPQYQFVYKKLLYSDFYIIESNYNGPLLIETKNITKPFVSDAYLDEHLSFIRPLLDGKLQIDEISISIPCGMRNGSDNISYLQNIGGSAMSKSGKYNILLKNANLSDDDILNGITEILDEHLTSNPIGTNTQDIKFENYKS